MNAALPGGRTPNLGHNSERREFSFGFRNNNYLISEAEWKVGTQWNVVLPLLYSDAASFFFMIISPVSVQNHFRLNGLWSLVYIGRMTMQNSHEKTTWFFLNKLWHFCEKKEVIRDRFWHLVTTQWFPLD